MTTMCFQVEDDVREFVFQMSNAYRVSMSEYLRKILMEEMKEKGDVLKKIGQIKDLQAEIRRMEAERQKLEDLINAITEKRKEVERLQSELNVA